MQTIAPRDYLKIDIANSFGDGLDRKKWDERIAWYNQNEANLPALLSKAKNPAMYYAGLQAMRDVQQGKPTGYAPSFDATSSGLQIYSVLVCCPKSASMCNVVNREDGSRADAYLLTHEAMQSNLGSAFTVDRADVKQAVMTALYSSEAIPKEVFGTGTKLGVFYSTCEEEMPGAWKLNQDLLGLWNPDALSHDWIMPDNFHVVCKVKDTLHQDVTFLDHTYDITTKVNAPVESGRSMGANIAHSCDGFIVREMNRRCNYNPAQIAYVREICENIMVSSHASPNVKMAQTIWSHYRKSGFLSARILDYVDPSTIQFLDRAAILGLINSLPAKPFQLLTVHDCFRCLPTYVQDMRWQYTLIMALIAKSSMLEFIVNQLVDEPINFQKYDPNMWEQVLEAEYMLS